MTPPELEERGDLPPARALAADDPAVGPGRLAVAVFTGWTARAWARDGGSVFAG